MNSAPALSAFRKDLSVYTTTDKIVRHSQLMSFTPGSLDHTKRISAEVNTSGVTISTFFQRNVSQTFTAHEQSRERTFPPAII